MKCNALGSIPNHQPSSETPKSKNRNVSGTTTCTVHHNTTTIVEVFFCIVILPRPHITEIYTPSLAIFACNDYPPTNHPSSLDSTCSSSEATPFGTVHCSLCSIHCST